MVRVTFTAPESGRVIVKAQQWQEDWDTEIQVFSQLSVQDEYGNVLENVLESVTLSLEEVLEALWWGYE